MQLWKIRAKPCADDESDRINIVKDDYINKYFIFMKGAALGV